RTGVECARGPYGAPAAKVGSVRGPAGDSDDSRRWLRAERMTLMTSIPVKTRLTLWLSLIRTRLTLWLIVILAVGMLAFVLTTLLAAHTILQNLNEERLRQSVSSLSDALAQEPAANFSLVRNQLDAFSTPEIYLQYQSH